MSKINRSDLELLQKIFKYLVVELKADKASRKEVLAAIKASGIKVLPAGALKFLIKEGFVVEDGDDIIIIKNKGGEKITSKETSEEKEIPENVKNMIWEIAEVKGELFKEFPTIFGGIKSIEYGGKALTLKNKRKIFFNFYTKEGEEAIRLMYFCCKGMGLIK